MYSHSKVDTYEKCPFKFKLKYVDELETLPNLDDADNPLIIGTALHHGLEGNVEDAIKEYFNSYPIITDKHEEEALKLEYLIPKGKALIPDNVKFEVMIEDQNFIGFIDLLVDVGNGEYDIWDFKYSNHIDRYLESRQLHLYKYFAEKCLGIKVRKTIFMFFPKIMIRQKKTENQFQFRERLKSELNKAEITLQEVPYDEDKVKDYLNLVQQIESDETFSKNQTKLCDWCEYKDYCSKGDMNMILPKNERRTITNSKKKVIWIYGSPFSGKTYLADKFPSPLMLNTDGNIKFVTAPYIAIRNEVVCSGRTTNTTLAWQNFKDVISELEKKQNDFKTIIIDLLEDVYEYCRLYMYDQMGITHESDDAFKAWDKVRTEFLSTIKRVMAMDYENIILISHEDMTKDITKRSGDKITAIKPNLPDKVATKIAGMVDIVLRCVVIDGERLLTCKTDETVFGGGRLNLTVNEIPNTYEDLLSLYGDVDDSSEDKPEVKEAEKPEVKEETKVEEAPEPRKRERKRKEEATPVEEKTEEAVSEEATENAPTSGRVPRRRRIEQ